MRLILITNSDTVPDETVLVTTLFEHGLETLHLRKPGMSTAEMCNYINAIPAHFHSRIIIHSHHQLVLRFELGGIHLTRVHRRRKLSNWIKLRWIKARRPSLIISASFHKLAQLYSEKGKYTYVLLGPLYDRQTKKFASGFNKVSLKTAIGKKNIPVIARGGIAAENAAELREIGFGGIAIQNSFWNCDDPLQEFLNIVTQLQSAGISIS
ncbi:MAG: thiamine phosphate synthase [Bacteroidota bacterium]|jgi:thiamine-phosphate pyrophosphorylase